MVSREQERMWLLKGVMIDLKEGRVAYEDGMKLRARVMRKGHPEAGPRPIIQLSDDTDIEINTW